LKLISTIHNKFWLSQCLGELGLIFQRIRSRLLELKSSFKRLAKRPYVVRLLKKLSSLSLVNSLPSNVRNPSLVLPLELNRMMLLT